MDMACQSCRYFEAFIEPTDGGEREEPKGICRRYPPETVVYVGTGISRKEIAWPTVWFEDWCGEYAAKGDKLTTYPV